MRKAKPIQEQTIVITGASSGIGLATARMAAAQGANVVLCSRNTKDLKKIAKELEEQGAKALAVEADVTSEAQLMKVREQALARFGGIDTWINNAGTSIYGSLLEVPFDDEKRLFETNFWSVRHGCRIAADAMKEKGGVIINLGSEVSGRSVPLQGIYSATKHAIKAYTDAFRMEVESMHMPISVCLVRPTAINTPFPDHAKNYLKKGEPSLPAPVYHPDVVAKAILHCAAFPQRDVYVGGASRLYDILDAFAPRLLDLFMERSAIDEQSHGTTIPHTEAQEALSHAPETEGQAVGASPDKMRERSVYTSLSQFRWRRAALLGTVAAAGVFAFRKRAPVREPAQKAA